MSRKLINIVTAKTKAATGCKKSRGIRADRKITGNASLESLHKVTNRVNRKQEIKIKKDKVSKLMKVLIDKEKTKS